MNVKLILILAFLASVGLCSTATLTWRRFCWPSVRYVAGGVITGYVCQLRLVNIRFATRARSAIGHIRTFGSSRQPTATTLTSTFATTIAVATVAPFTSPEPYSTETPFVSSDLASTQAPTPESRAEAATELSPAVSDIQPREQAGSMESITSTLGSTVTPLETTPLMGPTVNTVADASENIATTVPPTISSSTPSPVAAPLSASEPNSSGSSLFYEENMEPN